MNNKIKFSLIVLASLIILSVGISFIPSISLIESFRIIFGSFFVLFLPGYFLTYIFFPSNKSEIDFLERIALSFALSIAIVPLAVFYLNLIGLKISATNTIFITLSIILIEIIIILYFQRTNKNGKEISVKSKEIPKDKMREELRKKDLR